MTLSGVVVFYKATDKVGGSLLAIRWQVYEKTILAPVPYNLKDEVLAHEGFSSHDRKDSAAQRLKPVNCRFGSLKAHTWSVIVVLKTIMAVQVTFPVCKKITEDRAKLVRMDSRVYIGYHPAI
jgi:hypothetical protein